MGGNGSKKVTCHNLTEIQKLNIFKMFDAITREEVPLIKREMLQKKWRNIFSERILELILRYLFKKTNHIKVEELELFYFKMVESTASDRSQLLVDIFGKENSIPIGCLETYVTDWIESFITTVRKKDPESFSSWVSGDVIEKSDLNILTEFFLRNMKYKDDEVGVTELEQWLLQCFFVNDMLDSVMKFAFNMDMEVIKPVLPRANKYSSILTVPLVLALSYLVNAEMKKDWRLLYSSFTDAQSWNVLHKKVAKQGPTIVLLEDAAGPLFGGFASQSWKICPTFYGDECCFLFRLKPQMDVFSPTGYNKNFQYLNLGASTLPNGLGMGGQLHYFTFFLNSGDFGPGTVSKSCTTFKDYIPLTSEGEFFFSKLEIWGIANPEKEAENVKCTGLIMDRDPAAAAILDIVGRTGYSKNISKSSDEN